MWVLAFINLLTNPTPDPKYVQERYTLHAYPRGSIYTTMRELGPQIPYYGRNYGSQFPNGYVCGPSGYAPYMCIFCFKVSF